MFRNLEYKDEENFEINKILSMIQLSFDYANLALIMFEYVKKSEVIPTSLPNEYKQKLPFLYAHHFVYSLDEIVKLLNVLSIQENFAFIKNATIARIKDIKDTVEKQIPGLKDLRDSAHHKEDRIRNKNKKNQDIHLQPINNEYIKSSSGTMVIGNLSDNKLGYTGNDGTLKEVEIDKNNISIIEKGITDVIAALSEN